MAWHHQWWLTMHVWAQILTGNNIYGVTISVPHIGVIYASYGVLWPAWRQAFNRTNATLLTCQLDLKGQISVKFQRIWCDFHWRKRVWTDVWKNGGYFVPGPVSESLMSLVVLGTNNRASHLILIMLFAFPIYCIARDTFHTGFFIPYFKSFEIIFDVTLIPTIQPGHKFAHVATAQLSRHVQNCDLIGALFTKLEQHFFQGFDYELLKPLWNGSPEYR